MSQGFNNVSEIQPEQVCCGTYKGAEFFALWHLAHQDVEPATKFYQYGLFIQAVGKIYGYRGKESVKAIIAKRSFWSYNEGELPAKHVAMIYQKAPGSVNRKRAKKKEVSPLDRKTVTIAISRQSVPFFKKHYAALQVLVEAWVKEIEKREREDFERRHRPTD